MAGHGRCGAGSSSGGRAFLAYGSRWPLNAGLAAVYARAAALFERPDYLSAAKGALPSRWPDPRATRWPLDGALHDAPRGSAGGDDDTSFSPSQPSRDVVDHALEAAVPTLVGALRLSPATT